MATDTLTDNELIAEFMGRRYGQNADRNGFLKYDTSWDHLMPVVEKIESLQYKKYLYVIDGYKFVINKRHAEVMDIEGETITRQQVGESKIEAVYKAVVEFIKWYNQQTKTA